MPWRFPPTNVTVEDNGPGADGEDPPFDEGDDDDLEAGWPVSQDAADLLGNAYRFLAWRRHTEGKAI
jgi:hypothetical protein